MVQANGNSVKLHDQDTDTLSLQDSVTMQPERFRCITYLNFTVTSREEVYQVNGDIVKWKTLPR